MTDLDKRIEDAVRSGRKYQSVDYHKILVIVTELLESRVNYKTILDVIKELECEP